jgi:hypothetical protein
MRLFSLGIRRVCAREFGIACNGIAGVDYEPLLIGDGFRTKTLAAKVLCTLCREAGQMHAAHIGSLEAVSAAPPLKVSGASHPSPAPKSFGLSWQGEMIARAANTLATNARASNANATDAMRRSKASGEVAPGTITRDKESSALTVEIKSAGNTEQEPLSKAKGSDALKFAPKTAVDNKATGVDSEAGVEAGPEVETEVSSPAAFENPSAPLKAASLGMKRDLSSMIGTKEKNAVARSIHGTDEGPAAALGNEATVSATPELMAQMGVGRTVGMPIATTSGGHADSEDLQTKDVVGKSCLKEKITSPGMKRDWPSMAGTVEKNTVAKPAQAAGESTAATTGKVAAARNVAAAGKVATAEDVAAAGKVSTARREAAAGKETVATSLEPGTKPGKGQTVAALNVSDSGRRASLDGLQSASTVLQPVSTGMAGASFQTLAPGHASVQPAGAELRSGAASSAEGAVSTGHQVMAAGPGRLDIGVFDGTHGWLRIRAELGAGGAVNASLTASAPAHEALRAAVPEMASYLQSEAVNVSRIAVHRVAENSSSMSLPPGGSQQDGDAQGHRGTRDGAGAAQRSLLLENGDASGPASGSVSSATDESAAGATGLSGWIGGLSGAMPWIATAGGYRGGGSGSWLNVSA